MEKKGNDGSGSCRRSGFDSQGTITADQVLVLKKLFNLLPQPSFFGMLEMVSEFPMLSNLKSEQIKTWFENRRNGDDGFGSCSRIDFDSQVSLTADQVLVLEKLFNRRPQPSFFQMLERVREFPILSNHKTDQIQTWFENRRNGDDGFGSCSIKDFDSQVTLTDDQVIVLEKLFDECPKPSLFRRLEMVHETPVLSNLNSEQIKAWFEYRRMIEEQMNLTLQIQSENDMLCADKEIPLTEKNRIKNSCRS